MTQPLTGRRVLVVEDESLVAMLLETILEDMECVPIGPASNVDDGQRLARDTENLDAALLDVNVAGRQVFPVAEALKERGVPFVFSTGYGEGGYNDVVAALAAKNLKPVHVARFDLGVKDLTAELTAARNAGANVVYSYTVGPENATIANGKKALGWKVPQVGPWPLSFPFFLEGAKDAAEGALMVQTFIAEPSNERRASFLSSYTRKYHGKVAVPMAAANAYDATYLLMYSFLGIRDGNLTGKAIKESLEGKMKTYYGVVTTYDKPFSVQDKDAITRNMLVMGMVKNGAITFAYPEDAKRNLIIQRKQ